MYLSLRCNLTWRILTPHYNWYCRVNKITGNLHKHVSVIKNHFACSSGPQVRFVDDKKEGKKSHGTVPLGMYLPCLRVQSHHSRVLLISYEHCLLLRRGLPQNNIMLPRRVGGRNSITILSPIYIQFPIGKFYIKCLHKELLSGIGAFCHVGSWSYTSYSCHLCYLYLYLQWLHCYAEAAVLQ